LGGGVDFFFVGDEEAGGAGGTELFLGEAAVAVEGAVAVESAEFEVLGHEEDDRNTGTTAKGELLGEVDDLVAVDEPHVDLVTSGGDVGQQWALLDVRSGAEKRFLKLLCS